MADDDPLSPRPFRAAHGFRSLSSAAVPPLAVDTSERATLHDACFATLSSPISPAASHSTCDSFGRNADSPPSTVNGPFPPVSAKRVSPASVAPLVGDSPSMRRQSPPPVKPRKFRVASDASVGSPAVVPVDSNDPPGADVTWKATPVIASSVPYKPDIAPPLTNGAGGHEAPAVVQPLDCIRDGVLAQFVALSKQIGGDVDAIAEQTRLGFDAMRDVVWRAAGATKPAADALPAFLSAVSDAIAAVTSFRESRRSSDLFNHLSAVSEAIAALGWVSVAPTPAPFIKEMSDASQFYTNRVLKDYKEKDKTHVEWTRAWMQVLKELHDYVKQYHTTGLVYNSSPGSAPPGAAARAVPPGPTAPPGAPPPPPPPLPADLLKGIVSDSGDSASAALFADINKGLDITSSLKKVTDDMKTHKNPALRTAGGPPPLAPKPVANGASAAAACKAPPPTAKPAKCELEGGKKWIVEFQKGNRNLTIEAANMKQVIYMYKCEDSVLQVRGKVNSITMDSCKKTSVVFDNLVSAIDIVNCQSAQIQALGTMPTVAVQKTDGCQIYLSAQCLDTAIVTSKSSEMNVLVPDEAEGFKEFAIPEQFKTVWDGGKFDTSVLDIA